MGKNPLQEIQNVGRVSPRNRFENYYPRWQMEKQMWCWTFAALQGKLLPPVLYSHIFPTPLPPPLSDPTGVAASPFWNIVFYNNFHPLHRLPSNFVYRQCNLDQWNPRQSRQGAGCIATRSLATIAMALFPPSHPASFGLFKGSALGRELLPGWLDWWGRWCGKARVLPMRS